VTFRRDAQLAARQLMKLCCMASTSAGPESRLSVVSSVSDPDPASRRNTAISTAMPAAMRALVTAVTWNPSTNASRAPSVRAGDAVHADLAWSYRTPLPESQKIAGLISFYNEKVDLFVDGVLQERPSTKFS